MRRITRVMMTSSFVIAVIAGVMLLREIPFYALYGSSSPHITTLFPPDDDAYASLKQLIDYENRCIYIAAYRLTDNDVANTIRRASERGVDVQVVADASALEARYNKVLEMPGYGVSVYVFPPLS